MSGGEIRHVYAARSAFLRFRRRLPLEPFKQLFYPHFLRPLLVGKSIPDVKRPWEHIREALGMPNLRIHDLRHTYASLLISAGEPLPVIGRLLGHSQYQTTLRYAHLLDEPLRAATNRIGVMTTAGDTNES